MLVPELVEGKKRNYCFPRSGPRRRRAGRSGGNQRNSIPFDKLRDQYSPSDIIPTTPPYPVTESELPPPNAPSLYPYSPLNQPPSLILSISGHRHVQIIAISSSLFLKA